MLLYFPQWQGAGQGEHNRIDRPAKALFEAVSAGLPSAKGKAPATIEVPLQKGTTLQLEGLIFGREPILKQLTAAHDLLQQHRPDTVATVGGDCGIEVAPVAYLSEKYKDFALVWIDAHPDLNTPQSSPSKTFHGMPLRVLMGEGDRDFTALVLKPLSARQVVLVGLRSIDVPEQAFIDAQHIPHFPVETPDIGAAIVKHLRFTGAKHVYIHVDLDALDPAIWPYMHYPEPHGFTIPGLTRIVTALESAFTVVGMSITEYDAKNGQGLDVLTPLLEKFTAVAAR